MNNTIYPMYGTENRIKFRSLIELFNLHEAKTIDTANKMARPSVIHYIATEIKPDAETCREILLKGFRPDPTILRSRVATNDPAVIALYRGFPKFMLEDLEKNPYTANTNRSQRRKLASKAALDMVEVTCPCCQSRSVPADLIAQL